MNTLTLRLPRSLHQKIKDLAKAEGISINQFLVTAAAEKMSALLTQEYLEAEAAKSKRDDFEKVMQAVPDVEPESFDGLQQNRRVPVPRRKFLPQDSRINNFTFLLSPSPLRAPDEGNKPSASSMPHKGAGLREMFFYFCASPYRNAPRPEGRTTKDGASFCSERRESTVVCSPAFRPSLSIWHF